MDAMENDDITTQRSTTSPPAIDSSTLQPTVPTDSRNTSSQQDPASQPDTAVSPQAPSLVGLPETQTVQPQQPEHAGHTPAQTPAVQSPLVDGQAALATAQTADASTLHYMDVADLLTLKIVSDPQISPDGKLIAFSVLHCDAETNTTGSSIWLVNSTGDKTSTPRQLTGGQHFDTTPRWSPDGNTLAFLSDRTGTVQIFLLPMGAGEAQQSSRLQQGVSEYSWRPDGQAILAHSYWKPQDEYGPSATEEMVSIYTRLDAQDDGTADKHGRHKQLWLLSLAGQVQRITLEPVDLEQSCWSPDGQQLVFCANRRQDPDLSASCALWLLTLATGQMRRLTPEDGVAQMPSWSPDGKTIAYLYSSDQGEMGNISPWLVDAAGDAHPRLATQGAETLTCQTWIIDELRDEWLAPPIWYPDSSALLVPVQEQGQVHLYRLDLHENSIQRLTSGNGRYLSPQLSKDGQTIAMVRADWFTPGDIWYMESVRRQPHKLTRINDAVLQRHQLIRPRRIRWQSFDGLEMEGWLYLPPLAPGSKAPLILMPHGGPTLAWGDAYVHEFQLLAGRGYAVFAPNPRGSAGYGEEFSRQVLNDWGGADFHDLMVGLDYVISTEPVDEQRLGVEGMSYGGYMTNWIITQNDRFKAAVSRNGISSLASAGLLADQPVWYTLNMEDEKRQQERSPLTHADAVKTPLLLLHAEDDLSCPFSESLRFFVALRRRKHSVELVRYHHASHLMDWPSVGTPHQRTDRLRRTLQWFERFL